MDLFRLSDLYIEYFYLQLLWFGKLEYPYISTTGGITGKYKTNTQAHSTWRLFSFNQFRKTSQIQQTQIVWNCKNGL